VPVSHERDIISFDHLHRNCDQKLASDSSGLPGGFSGQRAWVRILKNGRQAAIVLSWLLLVQLPGQVL
jgi:hypothetical protein